MFALLLAVLAAGLAAAGSVVAGQVAPAEPGLDPANFTQPPPPGDGPLLGEPTPVADDNGDLIRCSDGELLLVPYGEGPPPGIAENVQVSASEAAAEIGPGAEVVNTIDPAVARCGPNGGGADGVPIWVPASEGKNLTAAPRSYVRQQTR